MRDGFEDIRISGIDEQRSGRRHPQQDALVEIALTLSKSPPGAWGEYFGEAWRRRAYACKQHVEAIGRHIFVFCVPEDLERDHLPKLRDTIEETNQAYRRLHEEQVAITEAARARDAATKAEIQGLSKSIAFD